MIDCDGSLHESYVMIICECRIQIKSHDRLPMQASKNYVMIIC